MTDTFSGHLCLSVAQFNDLLSWKNTYKTKGLNFINVQMDLREISLNSEREQSDSLPCVFWTTSGHTSVFFTKVPIF